MHRWAEVSGRDAATQLLQLEVEARAAALLMSNESTGSYCITVDLRRLSFEWSASGGLVLTMGLAQSRGRVAAPKVMAAVFSGDEGVVTVAFDRATNRAGFVYFFRCGLLLWFAGSQAAQCRWTTSAAIAGRRWLVRFDALDRQHHRRRAWRRGNQSPLRRLRQQQRQRRAVSAGEQHRLHETGGPRSFRLPDTPLGGGDRTVDRLSLLGSADRRVGVPR